MYSPHSTCRACGFGAWNRQGKSGESPEKLVSVLNLGVQPLANDFCEVQQERAGFAPLEVLFCPRCGLGQLSVNVRPEVLYRHYAYVTSPSQTMLSHLGALTTDLSAESPMKRVVEVGSNDGRFLDLLQKQGRKVVGIDPATNLAEMAVRNGVPTINEFFTMDSAARALEVLGGHPDVIIARHVFCHIPDWKSVLHSLCRLSDKNTLIAIEVPYVMDQLAGGSFDQVYHEHLSYAPVRAFAAWLKDSPFHVHSVSHYAIHGGCILVKIRSDICGIEPDSSVGEYIEKERSLSANTWMEFSETARLNIQTMREKVLALVKAGKRVCGYGASAKATVWCNACGFTRNEVAFICDSTASKVYRTCPGTDIPIVHEGEHYTQCADYVILFAWNYSREIIGREQKIGHGGFDWIIPVPTPEVICNPLSLVESVPER